MRLDKFGNPVFNEDDLFNALYTGHKLTSDIFVDHTESITQLETASNLGFWFPLDEFNYTIADYDAAMQADWKMPASYKTMDIEGFLASVCPKENYQRLVDELQEFKNRNMLDLLRWLKYFVDEMTAKDVVWGVGRGSSVASYVLYLIGVHSIDPIKYNLDWQEFLR